MYPKSNQGLNKSHNYFTQLTTVNYTSEMIVGHHLGGTKVYSLPMFVCL